MTNLVWLHHHAAVVTDHLAGCHDVHWSDACSETAHLLHPVQEPHDIKTMGICHQVVGLALDMSIIPKYAGVS